MLLISHKTVEKPEKEIKKIFLKNSNFIFFLLFLIVISQAEIY
jgi:hypothetical protein